VERIEALIADYNAGSINIDEYLRRFIELSKTLTEEEQRAVREDLSEEALVIFDLLTKADPVLTTDQLQGVKTSAKRCWRTFTTSWYSTGAVRPTRPPMCL
jgi:type I restriction enzyme R subunit